VVLSVELNFINRQLYFARPLVNAVFIIFYGALYAAICCPPMDHSVLLNLAVLFNSIHIGVGSWIY